MNYWAHICIDDEGVTIKNHYILKMLLGYIQTGKRMQPKDTYTKKYHIRVFNNVQSIQYGKL